MLVMTRHIGEEIIINGNIKVVILGHNGTQYKVGIEAPREISVHRKEIQDRVDKGIKRDKETFGNR